MAVFRLSSDAVFADLNISWKAKLCNRIYGSRAAAVQVQKKNVKNPEPVQGRERHV